MKQRPTLVSITLACLLGPVLPIAAHADFRAGTYRVGSELVPGIYAGNAKAGLMGIGCYWERLKGVSGNFSDILANANVVGQFYVELLTTDKYFKIGCRFSKIADWPKPKSPLTDIEPGTYIVGRDIGAGTYEGQGGSDVLSSCYWQRSSGVSGGFGDIIANDNASGRFFVEVLETDFALSTACNLELVSE